MPGASWFTTTMSSLMPHLAEGCPSGIYANTIGRTSVANLTATGSGGNTNAYKAPQECQMQ